MASQTVNQSKSSRIIFEWVDVLVPAIVFVVLLTSFVFRTITVNGESMLPTLENNDRIICNHFFYEPKKGDIIVINRPGYEEHKNIIKRVIATAGDTLKIDFEKGEVYVNGSLLEESYIKEPTTMKGDAEIPEVIPENSLFVMGDNRNGSTDSRFKSVGIVNKKNVLGKAMFRIFPFNRIGLV